MSQNKEVPHHIRIGTAGWSYPDWRGRVYPKPQPRGFDPLSYLAQYFDTVEINSSFYRIPAPKTTHAWVARVADHPQFRFTSKLWQGFTHGGQAGPEDERAFRQAMAPLHEAGKLGAVLLQFPYRFHHTSENRAYVQRLAEVFRDYPLVFEVRHRSWDRLEVYDWLRACGIGFCNIDQPQVSYSMGLTQVVTSSVGYLRLHGRHAAMWFAEEANRDTRYDYLYTAEELQGILDAVEVLIQHARDTYVIANNHGNGQAAVNALELAVKLRRSPAAVPPPLLAAYPQLRQVATPAPEADG